jgi:hypothetical protein
VKLSTHFNLTLKFRKPRVLSSLSNTSSWSGAWKCSDNFNLSARILYFACGTGACNEISSEWRPAWPSSGVDGGWRVCDPHCRFQLYLWYDPNTVTRSWVSELQNHRPNIRTRNITDQSVIELHCSNICTSRVNSMITSETSGSHGDEYEDGSILSCCSVQPGRSLLTFQGRLLLPSSGRWVIALMMEAASTSETSVKFYQTTRCNKPEDRHLQYDHKITSQFMIIIMNYLPLRISKEQTQKYGNLAKRINTTWSLNTDGTH